MSSSPQTLACSTLPLPYSQYTSNPVVVALLKIWAQIRGHFCGLPFLNQHPSAKIISSLHVQDLYVERSFASLPAMSHVWISLDIFNYGILQELIRPHSRLSQLSLVWITFSWLTPPGHVS